MDWKQTIQHWRALPEAEKHRIRWQRIPRSVAASMAFEHEPVSLAMLEADHARQPMPPVTRAASGQALSLPNDREQAKPRP